MTTLIRIIGIVILVGGIVVLSFGLRSSQSAVERGVEKTIGRYSEGTMWYVIGGIVMTVGGAALAINARRISKDR